MRGRGLETPWWQVVGLTLLAAATVFLCYLALTKDSAEPDSGSVARDPIRSVTDSPMATTSEPPDADTTGGELVEPTSVPEVADQRRADFSQGDDLPDGARTYDSGGNVTGMAIRGGALTHGQPTEPDSAGLIETRLTSDVAALGFRVRFDQAESGSAALTAWQKSFVASMRDDAPPPDTGLRLVVSIEAWQLSFGTGEGDVIAQGTYLGGPGSATFEVVRDGATVYVVDPSGSVTTAKDNRVANLAGPWASWGLSETGPEQKPAAIEEVWAG